jgi:hypothetical protein
MTTQTTESAPATVATSRERHKYRICKSIPIPKEAKPKPESKYPFKDMKVGHSILLVPKDANSGLRTASYYAKKHRVKFVAKKGPDGTRIWRVK